ncbi:MAG TPA: agmatine deiminase family protein [Kofleriaceae bacterium]|nr:agmatine deiminase family protein [Kofleriaceae bacterium]
MLAVIAAAVVGFGRRGSRWAQLARGAAAGVAVSLIALWLLGRGHGHVATRLVAEDASAPLARVAIHYAPASDRVALGVWRQWLAVLPPRVEVDVEVAAAPDFDRLVGKLAEAGVGHLDRLHPVVVGTPITTWSRDRYAATVDDAGHGAILAPPRIATPSPSRAGDARSPFAISQALYHRDPHVADIVFEGGDLAATPRWIFADANLVARNVARGQADRASIEAELHRRFAQEVVWLGDRVGDVPRHHIMMYAVPLDDTTVAVGDVRAGVALLGDAKLELDDVDVQAARFDRAARQLAERGFRAVRVPALVLAGGGSFVTYTNAVFDRRADGTRVVYLPTYALPALDAAATAFYVAQGFAVVPIDVSAIYRLNGSLGCLVNVLARG